MHRVSKNITLLSSPADKLATKGATRTQKTVVFKKYPQSRTPFNRKIDSPSVVLIYEHYSSENNNTLFIKARVFSF